MMYICFGYPLALLSKRGRNGIKRKNGIYKEKKGRNGGSTKKTEYVEIIRLISMGEINVYTVILQRSIL